MKMMPLTAISSFSAMVERATRALFTRVRVRWTLATNDHATARVTFAARGPRAV